MSDDKIKGVAKFVSRNSNVLCEIDARKEVVGFNSFWLKNIINMYVEVPSNEEFMWDGSNICRKENNWFETVENGWE